MGERNYFNRTIIGLKERIKIRFHIQGLSLMLSRRTREKYGPVGSNTDSDSIRGVQGRDTTVMYIEFIFRNLFQDNLRI